MSTYPDLKNEPEFFSQNNVNINKNIEFNFSKNRKEKIKNYEPSAPPEYSDFQ